MTVQTKGILKKINLINKNKSKQQTKLKNTMKYPFLDKQNKKHDIFRRTQKGHIMLYIMNGTYIRVQKNEF